MMSPDQRVDITRRAHSRSQSYESSEGSSDCSDDKGSGNSSSDDSRNSSEAYDKFDIEGLPNDHHKNSTPNPQLKALPKIQFPGKFEDFVNKNSGLRPRPQDPETPVSPSSHPQRRRSSVRFAEKLDDGHKDPYGAVSPASREQRRRSSVRFADEKPAHFDRDPWQLPPLQLPHSALATKRRSTRHSHDPNLVTWENKDDPANPYNWPAHRKWTSTVLIAVAASIPPMASTMIAPALDTLEDEFDLESKVEEFLLMTIFLLGYALGPFLWGPFSEVFGRIRVIHGSNVVFLLFDFACGFARTPGQMMAFRFIAGFFGSGPQAVCLTYPSQS